MRLGDVALSGALAFGPQPAIFATVDFAEGWMYRTLGLYGSHVGWTLLLMLPTGFALRGLVAVSVRRRILWWE